MDTVIETKPQSRTRRFRANDAKRMEPNAMRRQAALAQSAWHHLRESAAAVTFINTHNVALGARPIDIAVASDEGLLRVLTELKTVSTVQP